MIFVLACYHFERACCLSGRHRSAHSAKTEENTSTVKYNRLIGRPFVKYQPQQQPIIRQLTMVSYHLLNKRYTHAHTHTWAICPMFTFNKHINVLGPAMQVMLRSFIDAVLMCNDEFC